MKNYSLGKCKKFWTLEFWTEMVNIPYWLFVVWLIVFGFIGAIVSVLMSEVIK